MNLSNLIFVSEKFRFIYLAIPKVATQTLMSWMLRIHDKEVPPYIPGATRKHFRLADREPAFREKAKSDYFSFAFVRNPWERLASAYMNKFVSQDLSVHGARRIAAHYERNSISFTDFLLYIKKTGPNRQDLHWKPQFLFIETFTPTFIGKLERFENDFEEVLTHLQITAPYSRLNQSLSAPYEKGLDCSMLASDQLRALPALPNWKNLYTSELLEMVSDLYRTDFQQFEYDDDCPL